MIELYLVRQSASAIGSPFEFGLRFASDLLFASESQLQSVF